MANKVLIYPQQDKSNVYVWNTSGCTEAELKAFTNQYNLLSVSTDDDDIVMDFIVCRSSGVPMEGFIGDTIVIGHDITIHPAYVDGVDIASMHKHLTEYQMEFADLFDI